MHRQHVTLCEYPVELDELHARKRLRAAVPGQHLHAHAQSESSDLRRDPAEAEQPDRASGELKRLGAHPVPGAHFAVHPREAARRGPHQRHRTLGYRRVAIALDRVYRDAELTQFFGTHVAAHTGAKEDDVL